MYRPEPGVEPRVSRLTYERSANWANQVVYNYANVNSGFIFNYPTVVLCVWAHGVWKWCRYAGCYNNT